MCRWSKRPARRSRSPCRAPRSPGSREACTGAPPTRRKSCWRRPRSAARCTGPGCFRSRRRRPRSRRRARSPTRARRTCGPKRAPAPARARQPRRRSNGQRPWSWRRARRGNASPSRSCSRLWPRLGPLRMCRWSKRPARRSRSPCRAPRSPGSREACTGAPPTRRKSCWRRPRSAARCTGPGCFRSRRRRPRSRRRARSPTRARRTCGPTSHCPAAAAAAAGPGQVVGSGLGLGWPA